MKKKTMMIAVLVCCVFASFVTVNAVSRKGETISYNGTAMIAVTHDTINGKFHTSVYPTEKSYHDTITIYNEVYRKNLLGVKSNVQSITFYITELEKSYIYNTSYGSKAWTKSDWWIQTKDSAIKGNFYLVNGHDLG
ncbi:MAG: hypothetical protein K2G03_01715 [Bacilli bacterium]|nr:hypothetical protein [Bacilli bacterium]